MFAFRTMLCGSSGFYLPPAERTMSSAETISSATEQDLDDQDPMSWDLNIGPERSVFQVPFGELWRYRDLLYLFVRRDFVSFYKQTVLGPVWFFLQPLLTAGIYYVIFGKIAELSTNGCPPILFYLTGVTFWNYFSECFVKTSETFVANSQLFGKVYFPRLVVPLSIVVSNLVRFFIQFGLLAIVWLWFVSLGVIVPTISLFLLPLVVVLMAMIGLGIGLIFSAATTKYRDLRFLIQFGVQLLMYATPVIYPISIAHGSWRSYLVANPLAPLFEAVRHGLLGSGDYSFVGLAWTIGFAVISLIVGVLMFNLTERNVIDTV